MQDEDRCEVWLRPHSAASAAEAHWDLMSLAVLLLPVQNDVISTCGFVCGELGAVCRQEHAVFAQATAGTTR